MAIDTVTHGVLVLGALAASYVALREYDIHQSGERAARILTLEVGSLFASFLWAVVAFNSFKVTAGDAGTATHTGLALLAGGAGIVLGLVFVTAAIGNIEPAERSVMEGSRR